MYKALYTYPWDLADEGLADLIEHTDHRRNGRRPRLERLVVARDHVEQAAGIVIRADDLRLRAGGEPVDDPGADRVDMVNAGEIDPRGIGDRVDALRQVAQMRERQAAREDDGAALRVVAFEEVGGLRHRAHTVPV